MGYATATRRTPAREAHGRPAGLSGRLYTPASVTVVPLSLDENLHLGLPSSYVVRIGDRPEGGVVPRTPITHRENDFKIRVLEETVPVFLQRFRVCRRAGCGRPFIMRKRQLYCGRRCSQAERTRRYRPKHPDYLERAHEIYARRQRVGRPVVRVRRYARGRKR